MVKWSQGGVRKKKGAESESNRDRQREKLKRTAEIIHEPAEREKKKCESEEQGREA